MRGSSRSWSWPLTPQLFLNMYTIDIEPDVEMEPLVSEANLGFMVRTEHSAYKKYFRQDRLTENPVTFPLKHGVLAARFVSVWEMISKK